MDSHHTTSRSVRVRASHIDVTHTGWALHGTIAGRQASAAGIALGRWQPRCPGRWQAAQHPHISAFGNEILARQSTRGSSELSATRRSRPDITRRCSPSSPARRSDLCPWPHRQTRHIARPAAMGELHSVSAGSTSPAPSLLAGKWTIGGTLQDRGQLPEGARRATWSANPQPFR